MNMLEGAPWLLGHKSMLPTNKPYRVSLYGQDYVLWKDEQGKISGLSNVCPHMGAMLSEGWCQVDDQGESKVVCPFHALEFDGHGCTILPGENKKTRSLLSPIDLIIENDFIWSYGDHEAKLPIPDIINQIASEYEFVGSIGDTTVNTDLRSMLLNMHDYNHQNGTHRDLFEITEVLFDKFIDNGYHSEAFFRTPTAPKTFWQKVKEPNQFLLPDVIEAHLENYFPSLVIFHGENSLGTLAQCHFFVPESLTHTRTYVLLFIKCKNMLGQLLKNQFLSFAEVVIQQDVRILNHIYPNTPQKIKLNNEVGMDWVKSNFDRW